LLEAAASAGVARVLVISSMSAYPGTGQIYGQAKLAIERATTETGGIAIRPGLVWGGELRGMAGTLQRLTRLPVVPDFGPRAQQYPVHEDDLARVATEILEAPGWRPEVFGVAQSEAMSFRSLLSALAAQDHRKCRFLRVPWQPVYGLLALAEKLGVSGLRADSILGLIQPAASVSPSVAFPDLPQTLRPLGEGVAQER
jgi:nucleoside-diphosphate-sugar epimerase